jgi:UDP-glucose 4-epimerase
MGDKNILLIGGNGYIGCRLYDFLVENGYSVTNVDDCWYYKIYPETIVADYDTLSPLFLSNFTHVILLAGHSTVSMCEKNYHVPFDNNVSKYIKLIEKLDSDQLLIYSSTAAIYGNNSDLLDETYALQNPVNFYDYTKLCNEQIANLYPEKNIVGLRFGSLGGFSKNFRSENLLNSISVAGLLKKQIKITNPEKMRAILGINDLCRAMKALIDGGKPVNKIYNWASINDTILNFGNKIQQLTGCELIVENKNTTNYSFNCSTKLFENDYNFKFTDTVESIYNDIVNNYDKIVVNVKRT